jgi:hypothetical protein
MQDARRIRRQLALAGGIAGSRPQSKQDGGKQENEPDAEDDP